MKSKHPSEEKPDVFLCVEGLGGVGQIGSGWEGCGWSAGSNSSPSVSHYCDVVEAVEILQAGLMLLRRIYYV